MKNTGLVILFSFGIFVGIWGQDPLSKEISHQGFLRSLLGDEAQPLLVFLDQEHLLEQIDVRSLAPTKAVVDILEEIKKWETDQLFQDLTTKTQLGIDYYQLDNDTFHSLNRPQQYINLHLIQSIQIGNLPLSIRGDMILRDGQLDTRLTNASIQLDHHKVLDQMKEKLFGKLNQSQLLSFSENPLQLSSEAQAYLINELQYHFYQQVITRADFYQLKSDLLHQADSLALQLAESAQDRLQSDSIEAKIKIIRKIESLYRQHWDRKKSFDQSIINELHQKADKFAAQLQEYRDPRALKKALLQRIDLSFAEKWLLWSKDLELGLYHLKGSNYTAHNLALNGLHYTIEGQRWFGEVAWGRQSFSTNFFPTFSTSLLSRFSGNRNIYASIGIGKKEGDHLSLSFLNVREGSGPKDTLFVYPKVNTIVSLSGRTQISQAWNAEMEIAISDHDLVGTNLTGDGDRNYQPQTGAAEISFNYQPVEGWFSVGAGYFYVGPRFISLGNPFLLTNRQGLVTKIRTQIGKRISLDLAGKFGRSIGDDAVFEGQLSDIQLIGSLSWQLGKQGNIQAQFSPNTFKQSGAGTFNVSNYNTLVSIQGIFQHQLGESQWSNQIGYTNFRSNFTYYDTSSLDKSHYLFAQESLHFSSGFQISAVATLGGNGIWKGIIEEIFAQGSIGYQAGKWGTSLGLQILKDRFYPEWQSGLNTRLQLRIGKNLQLGIDIMWQKGLKKNTGHQRFLGHTSVGWRF